MEYFETLSLLSNNFGKIDDNFNYLIESFLHFVFQLLGVDVNLPAFQLLSDNASDISIAEVLSQGIIGSLGYFSELVDIRAAHSYFM